MRVRFDHKEKVANGIYMFWFVPEQPMRYTAGQFTELRFPTGNLGSRQFTLSSSPSEPLLAITTKIGPHRSVFKRSLMELTPSETLIADEPMGDFVLPKSPAIPLIFVAGGIGITPFRSHIKWLLDSGEQRPIKLLHAMRRQSEGAFANLFYEYGLQPQFFINQSRDALALAIYEQFMTNPESLIYLSGPEPMVEALAEKLIERGVPSPQVVRDAFLGYRQL